MKRTLAVCFVFCAVVGVRAQTWTPTLGKITALQTGNYCSASGWISGAGVTYAQATVQCPGISDINITFAYETPATPAGTIVFFSGGDGTDANGNPPPAGPPEGHAIKEYANDYYSSPTNPYQVVQTAWVQEWEDPSNGSGVYIGHAACRPATFLSYIRFGSNGFPPLWQTGGMCAHGESAGSAAIAYSLAWYSAGSGNGSGQNYLDKVSLLSGPVLSDIEQGCRVIPNIVTPLVTVCPSGQLGCNSTNSPSSWSHPPLYDNPGPANDIDDWTQLTTPGCNAGQDTGSENATWKSMSIVDGNFATFNYQNTNITGWLCSSVETGTGSMNVSSPQGQLFYQNFTNASQFQGLLINGVSTCDGPEGVGAGIAPSSYGTNVQGWVAIERDMTDTASTTRCTSHRGH